MKAMLLSAGFGMRMLPLTLTIPKPALPVLGRPIALQALHRMGRYGVREAVVNLHHLAGEVRAMLGAGEQAGLPAIRFSFEEEILGTGGGVGRAAAWLRGEGPVLVSNCDFLSDIDIGAVLKAHRSGGHLATLVVAPARDGYSRVDVDADGRVLSLAGIPEADPSDVDASLLFTGLQVLDESLLDRIPADRPSDIVRDLYRGLAAEGRLGSWLHDGFWWEFGTPTLYLEGTYRLLGLDPEQRHRVALHDPVSERGDCTLALGTGAQVHHDSILRGRLALGFASHVSERVRLEDSVVMPEAWLGPGCRLTRTIVGPSVELPAGFVAEDVMICQDPGGEVDVPAVVRRIDGLLVRSLRQDEVTN